MPAQHGAASLDHSFSPAGVPLATVNKRLGHSNVAATAAIYAHSFAADEIAAAEAWENKMGQALRKAGGNLVAPFGTTRPLDRL